jgi:hypothetical protein
MLERLARTKPGRIGDHLVIAILAAGRVRTHCASHRPGRSSFAQGCG